MDEEAMMEPNFLHATLKIKKAVQNIKQNKFGLPDLKDVWTQKQTVNIQ